MEKTPSSPFSLVPAGKPSLVHRQLHWKSMDTRFPAVLCCQEPWQTEAKLLKRSVSATSTPVALVLGLLLWASGSDCSQASAASPQV